MPCHNELTYLANFKQHSTRLRQIAKILSDYGLRFGMEYVGTESLRNRRKFPFVHTLREGLELIDSIGLDSVGLVMDCWHWHNAQDTIQDLKLLSPKHVVSIELNDAQPGIARSFLQDNRRELPCSTGVIDTEGFLNGLAQQGVKGPVMAEPFNQPFRDMPRSQGIGLIAQSLRKALKLVQ
jgi:sugar phosphate isomerase/epimerase